MNTQPNLRVRAICHERGEGKAHIRPVVSFLISLTWHVTKTAPCVEIAPYLNCQCQWRYYKMDGANATEVPAHSTPSLL